MSTVFDSPILIISYDRPTYLAELLRSLKQQKCVVADASSVCLFQDGPLAEQNGRTEEVQFRIDKNIELFRTYFPDGTVFKSDVNLGIAVNIDRAEHFAFATLKSDFALLFEDDMHLNPYYLHAMTLMKDYALKCEDVAYVSAYGDHRASLEEQAANEARIVEMHHKWGFGLTRKYWMQERGYFEEYLKIVSGSNYRDRDEVEIRKLYERWGFGSAGTSQDGAKDAICAILNKIKIMTFVCHGKYIGEEGVHFNRKQYLESGYAYTQLYSKKVNAIDYLTDSQVSGIVERSRSHARACARQEHFLVAQKVENASELELLKYGLDLRGRRLLRGAVNVFEFGETRYPTAIDAYGHPVFSKERVRTLLMLGEWREAEDAVRACRTVSTEQWHLILFARALESGGKPDEARIFWIQLCDDPRTREEALKALGSSSANAKGIVAE